MIRDNYIDTSNLIRNDKVKDLFALVSRHGGVLRFVGGAVRDALMGIKGADLDLATDLSPEELAEACADENIETIPLGIKQSNMGVIIDGTEFKVGSLYKYVIKNDGSRDIEFTDNWEEDAARRDLTINAVYADENGNVFDYYNGIEDLEKGNVRFIGSATQRIEEDPVRILRFFRFYSLFGKGEPNVKALEACQENSQLLKKLPLEKIRDELFKIVNTPKAPEVYKLMQDHGILSYVMPDAEHIDDLAHLNEISKGMSLEYEALVKLFILYRPDSALAENLAVRLKLSRQEKHLFTFLADSSIRFNDFLDHKKVLKLCYEYTNDFCQAKFLTMAAQEEEITANIKEVYDFINDLPELVFPLKGKDIIDNGLTDPAKVGKILKELEQIWVDSDFDLTKEQLLVQVDNLKEVI